VSLLVDLAGRIALVTGAGGGIGAGIVESLLAAGATVAAADLSEDGLKERYAEDSRVLPVGLDVTDEEAAARAVARVVGELGGLDIVVNGAGVASRVGLPFTRLDVTDWTLPWQVNAVGTFAVTKAAVASLRRDIGAVVNVASVSGRTGMQTSPPYSASKAAVLNLTQVMARDLAPSGIRVNAVCPGMVFTPFYSAQRLAVADVDPAAAQQTDEEYFDAKVSRVVPLGRGQTARDIGDCVAFLASDLARSITGQAVNVDGGLVMS
jgi:2-hydroxycyclohexanecarboxyl-CoA dehydrogenase